MPSGPKEEKPELTKEAFEKLLTKAAQPIRKPSDPKAVETSESHRSDD